MTGPAVVKVGGALLDDAEAFAGFVRAIAALPAGGTVIVHGGGAATDRLLARLGIETPRVQGLRATPSDAIDAVVGSLSGTVNHRIVSALLATGVRAAGLTLTDAGLCRCSPMTLPTGEDLGRVGRAEAGDGAAVGALLDAGITPVVACIGDDGAGGALNVNADDAAVAVAASIGARGLWLLTDVDGVRNAAGATLASLDAGEAEDLIAGGVIAGGMIPKVRGALAASARLGGPVTIASWRSVGGTLAGERGGTRVSAALDEAPAERR